MDHAAKNHDNIMDMVYCALFVALIAVCSWISIPTAIPFTLQTFAICVTTALLGTRRGLLTVVAYLLLGAVGLPVYAGFVGGAGFLLGITGGYMVGFLFTALVVGMITEHFGKSIPVLALAMVIGILLCYAFGTAWFMVVYSSGDGPIGLVAALNMCVVPYLLPDVVKIVLAVLLVRRVGAYVR